jgi:hypothetical protein
MGGRRGQSAGGTLSWRTPAISVASKGSLKPRLAFAAARPRSKSSLKASKAKCRRASRSIFGQYARLTGVLCRLFELIGIKGRAKLDPMSELVRAMSAYPATAVDDSDEDEPPPDKA